MLQLALSILSDILPFSYIFLFFGLTSTFPALIFTWCGVDANADIWNRTASGRLPTKFSDIKNHFDSCKFFFFSFFIYLNPEKTSPLTFPFAQSVQNFPFNYCSAISTLQFFYLAFKIYNGHNSIQTGTCRRIPSAGLNRTRLKD